MFSDNSGDEFGVRHQARQSGSDLSKRVTPTLQEKPGKCGSAAAATAIRCRGDLRWKTSAAARSRHGCEEIGAFGQVKKVTQNAGGISIDALTGHTLFAQPCSNCLRPASGGCQYVGGGYCRSRWALADPRPDCCSASSLSYVTNRVRRIARKNFSVPFL